MRRPFNMGDPEGDPTYRVIPGDARSEDFVITHNYYDHRDADRDFRHYSFMGHIAGPHLNALEEKILPQLIADLAQERPDFVFLTPA